MAEERAKKLALNKKKVAEAKAAFAVEQAKLAEKLVLTLAIMSDSFNKNDEDNQLIKCFIVWDISEKVSRI